jgi:hypothetical protein
MSVIQLPSRVVRPADINLRPLTLDIARAHFKKYGSQVPIRICACDNHGDDIDGVKLMAFDDTNGIHSSADLGGELYLDGSLVKLDLVHDDREAGWLLKDIVPPHDKHTYALAGHGMRPFHTHEPPTPMLAIIDSQFNIVESETRDYYVCASDYYISVSDSLS